MAVPAHKTEYFIIENSNLQKKANTARGHRSRRNHRGKHGDRRGKRGNEGYPRECCRRWKSLPRTPGNKRTRQRILF